MARGEDREEKEDTKRKAGVPWKSLLTSGPVHVLWVTHITSSWGWYLMAVNTPLFAKEVFQFDVMSVMN